MRCHYWIFNTRKIRETIDSFARGPFVSSFQPKCVHFVDKNANQDQDCSFDLIYYQRSRVYTLWFSHMCLISLLAYMMNRRILIRKSAALRMLSWLPICLLFWWFYLLSVWWLGNVKIRLYGTIVAALVRTKSNGRFVKKKKISRNGLGIFHNSANDRDRWAVLIFCCQSNIWCLIMSTQPTLCPTNTHTNEKDTVYLMTSAHPTSGPHNLFSNFHHDEWTSFLITKLPKNKRKIFPKVLKVHINQSQFSLYSTSPRNQYKLKP